ncbi:oxygenase MpaB family protein [Microbacterium sp. M3]|uniref:Oxygenase MpaB family protein n=1 Tax=Microbacterium arthrosphaerae TaxID=792652 RepID=A0ABU4H404_9MICO|nr:MULTISPECIES: oxygenase MpaB family protein [Microbacterium]MDW4574066.1 oxygenase MpaB family protein [Microbacterium arthrosphaerae]MDW7607921.1 oxygenase MpaB family protein [Microbacterium sp. M3]
MHDRSSALDPETHFVEIYRRLGTYDFPWDLNQALSFALFRTYAVPSIGRLLDETGEFARATQKRYDDTSLLLEVPLLDGFDSPRGRAAIRRINQMHRMYDISNDDMRYVLSTFVVVPARWVHAFGWRPLTPDELLASVRYYQTLGRHMGIKDIPATYAGFAELMDAYEREHFAYDPASARVADRTLALLISFYPRFLAPVIEVFSRSLMDPPLLRAFGYREPGRVARRLSAGALRLRARAVAVLPKRRTPLYVHDLPRIRSYPDGFDIERMGTFAPGCPVPHGKPGDAASVD